MDYTKLFSELIFPVAVTAYLLITTTHEIKALREQITALREEIRVSKTEVLSEVRARPNKGE